MIAISKRLRYRFLVIFILIVTLSYLTSGCFSFRMSKSELDDFFKNKPSKPTLHQYVKDDWKINYADIGDKEKPTIIFVHGAPGSLSAFIHYLGDSLLLSKAHIITLDRPGYGYSNFGISEPSLERQVKLLKPILELSKSDQPTILVGHSLGGPVIARMAMDLPDLVDGLILVAPSIDPELEPEEWFRFPLHTPFLRWLLPKSFRVTNDEIYFLKDELEKMLPLWKGIDVPVTVIQGGKDNLVHPGNADFAKEKLINAPVTVVFKEDMNHFVPWNNYDLIKNAILNHLERGNKFSLPSAN